MADIRVNQLPDRVEIAASDILHILNTTTTDDVDNQTTLDEIADWIIANKSVRITGISDVPGLQAALDGKADIVHTHTVGQVIGLQADLDNKTDVSQAQIIGRNIILNGKSINVPSSIAGLQDDRIPNTVVVGEYLQFGTTGGGINNITGDDLKGNLDINLVDNTSDIAKPVSTLQQTALDTKVNTSTYTTGQAEQDTRILENTNSIAATALDILLNTQKRSYPEADETKLATIETNADVTDTTNVWSSLGISSSGSTGQFLTQRGVFVSTPEAIITKSEVDRAIGAGSEGTDYYSSNKTWLPIPTGGGTGTVTKAVIDAAIGATPTGDSAQFYNEQGNFVDAVYDSIEDAPIIRNRTIETITIAGTRTNVQVPASGESEMSTITMLDSFNPVPTQYTTTFTSPNTTLTPALSLPTGSQGRQLSLTELDGTVHRFCYLVNGNYRLLDGGLSGTVRLGPVAVATTATVTAAVTVPDQTAGQTITLAGDETGTFSVGDFISPQANNFGAYRGIFIDSITFDGTNTVIVGPSNGATTFNTTSVLRNAGPATEIQGTLSSFSYDPDTSDAVYSSSITSEAFTNTGEGITNHLTQIANSIAALESSITWDGLITSTTLPENIIQPGFANVYSSSFSAGNTWRFLFGTSSLEIPDGTEWAASTIDNIIIEDDLTSYDLSTGTLVRATLPNGAWIEWFTTGSDSVNSTSARLFINNPTTSGAIEGCDTFGNATQLRLDISLASSSITLDLGTETNIDSSFTITGGLNNMNSLANTDGVPGMGLTVSTTVTVLDPEATEVASQTFGVTDANDNNVDAVGNFINDAINNNTETPIDFESEYSSGVLTLTAEFAGNTNPWTIVINNNGATAANAGNLSTSTVQTGDIINQLDTSLIRPISNNLFIGSENAATTVSLASGQNLVSRNNTSNIFNNNGLDVDFQVRGRAPGRDGLLYDSGTNTLTTNATTLVGFGSSETGTWTPTFINTGTVGTITAAYTKVGSLVTCECTAAVAASTSTDVPTVQSSSLPFSIATAGQTKAIGTYVTSNFGILTFDNTSGIVATWASGIQFMDNSNNATLKGDGLRGQIGFTITYQTS